MSMVAMLDVQLPTVEACGLAGAMGVVHHEC